MGDDEPDVRNDFGGRADVVVQAGQVHGGVHVHARRPRDLPRLVPPPTPHFTNQRRVLAQADAAVGSDGSEPRILVFSGQPGLGKREVVRTWLDRHSDDFPDGQFHADLSTGLGGDGVVSTALREFLLAADVDASAIPDTVEGRAACFRSWSTGRRVAVVLDDALTPGQVRPLVPGPGSSVVLVTAAGGLAGLGMRNLVTFIDLDPLEPDHAVDLLGRLIGRDRVAGEPDVARELVAICDGLPIAVCVVGRLLGTRRFRRLARLADELRDERARLGTLSRLDELSVTAVFNTAYRRLTPVARRCHRALGIHPGTGGVSDDVLRAGTDLPADDLADAVEELLAAGLLHEEPDGDRYRQHPLLRLHARGLADDAESSSVLARMSDHYVRRAVRAGHALIPRRGWLDMFFDVPLGAEDPAESTLWLRAERENLRAVVEPMRTLGRREELCQLAVALWPLHERGKHFDDLVHLNEIAVEAARDLERPELAALCQIQLAFAHMQRGAPAVAYELCGSAATAAVGVPALEATAVESLGLAALALGAHTEAESLLRRNLVLAEAIGDPRRHALARFHLAKALDPEDAVGLLTEALAGFEDVSDGYNAAKSRWWLGRKLLDAGRFADARAQLDAALVFMRDGRMVYDHARILETLGDLAAATEDVAAAVRWFRESVAITESCGFVRDTERVRGRLAALGDTGDGDDVGGGAEGDG